MHQKKKASSASYAHEIFKGRTKNILLLAHIGYKKTNKQEDDFSHESKNCETTKPDINV